LIEPLGSGGFGEAWKCEAPGGLFKAIKFVFGNLNSLDHDGARAEQELKALNRVKEVRHPFVLSMDLIKVIEGELVIVMELADKSLHDVFEECVAAGMVGVPRDSLLRYIRDAAEALDHMNEKHGLQHLDIKPRNLFLVSDRVKVADFGLVKHLERSAASGLLSGVTPLYGAPETFTGQISGASDQYSLAIVYQELLTGVRPFNGKNPRQLAQQHMSEEPDLRSLPEAERPVVARALAKEPGKRFPNCLAFLRALYNARVPTRPPTLPDTGGSRPKTMADTLEDIHLGIPPGQDGNEMLESVDLGGPASGTSGEVSNLGVTIAAPTTGALRPTLVLGIGGVGRRALLELRCRLLDRFGDLNKLPLLQFLYLDTDPEAIRNAERGAPEVAFQRSEIAPLPLQQVGHYRRRQLDQLSDWLPREKLYSVPRSLKTQGSRALGRLAFADNYLRLAARLKTRLQAACHPDALYKTVSETGLALRDNVPRIYVVGSASGGGSGYLADLGYGIRRLLKQLRVQEFTLTSLLFCGTPDDPATPRSELANVYATLTELQHFSDPSLPFSAQYGPDGPRLNDEGPPFDQTYLLTLSQRTPAGRRDAVAHLGSYLFHELTTPLGLRLDRCRLKRSSVEAAPFRSLGTYGVWFPRGLMLRVAARHACARMLEEWQMTGEPTARAELEAAQARLQADPELSPESLSARLNEAVAAHLESVPADLLTRLLTTMEEQSKQSVAQDDPGAWARQALTRIQDWLGGGVAHAGAGPIHQRRSRLTKALEAAAAEVAQEWDHRLSEAALDLMEHPGRRLAVAEVALQRFGQFCDESAAAHQTRLQQQRARTARAQDLLSGALDACLKGSGFSWFGGSTRRQLRVFVDHLAAFARQCLAEDLVAAAAHVHTLLHGRLAERLRELTFCRQRLRHLQELLEGLDSVGQEEIDGQGAELSPTPTPLQTAESYWETIRETTTARVVLPDGVEELERAALLFLNDLTPEQWAGLDQAVQDQVLAARGGLYKACMSASDLRRHLAGPLIDQAVTVLGNHLPITDVAQVEFSMNGPANGVLTERIERYHELAAPLAGTPSSGVTPREQPDTAPPHDHAFLLVPASEAGKRYAEEAVRVLPNVHLVNVAGQADLMFCREQDALTAAELQRLLKPGRAAYDEVAHTPPTSPHSRFDIQDWTPLDT
jgi:serine/threonine protein kinase